MALIDVRTGDYGLAIARVSTAQQTTLPQYHRAMSKAALTLGIPIPEDGHYNDVEQRDLRDLSARVEWQRAAERMLKDPHCRFVFFPDSSRVFGDPMQALEILEILQEAEVRVFYSDGSEEDVQNAMAELMLAMKGYLNRQEVRNIRMRVKNTLHDMASIQKRLISRPPYGIDVISLRDAPCGGACGGVAESCEARHGNVGKKGMVWVIDEPECAALNFMFEWIDAGKSWHSLSKALTAQGILTQERVISDRSKHNAGKSVGGEAWIPSSIKRLLINPFYRGVFQWQVREVKRDRSNRAFVVKRQGEPIEFDHELGPLVDPELWWRVQDRIARTSRTREEQRKYPLMLWDGFIYCGRCGWKMSPRMRAGKRDAKGVFDYHCNGVYNRYSKCKRNHMIPEKFLDAYFTGVVSGIRAGGGDIVTYELSTAKAKSRAEMDRISARLLELDQEEDRAVDMAVRGRMSEGQLDRQQTRICDERKLLTERLGELTATPEDAFCSAAPPEALPRLMSLLRDPDVPIEGRRRSLSVLVDRVIIDRGNAVRFLLSEDALKA